MGRVRTSASEPNVVAAVGTAVGHSSSGRQARHATLEAAMAKAVEDCIAQAAANGGTFPSDERIRQAKQEAYEAAKARLDGQ